MAKGVQFRGIPDVMGAYDNAGLQCWAVLYDKNINAKYCDPDGGPAEARETLRSFLDLLLKSGSAAVYTLNLYEGLPKGAKITSRTEADYGFNFMLYSDADDPYRAGGSFVRNQVLMDRITQLEAKLTVQDSDDDAGEVGGVSGFLNGLLNDDRVKSWIQNKMFSLADQIFTPAQKTYPAKVMPMPAAAVGAVDKTKPYVITEEQNIKVATALEVLARLDPLLGDNLLKIAAIAENDPGKYSMLSKML